MAIDRDEVEHIARLARLELDAEAIQQLGGQLQSILDYVATLDDLDVSDVPPTAHAVSSDASLRADEPGPSLSREQALRSAADSEDGLFRVPRVLGEE